MRIFHYENHVTLSESKSQNRIPNAPKYHWEKMKNYVKLQIRNKFFFASVSEFHFQALLFLSRSAIVSFVVLQMSLFSPCEFNACVFGSGMRKSMH